MQYLTSWVLGPAGYVMPFSPLRILSIGQSHLHLSDKCYALAILGDKREFRFKQIKKKAECAIVRLFRWLD